MARAVFYKRSSYHYCRKKKYVSFVSHVLLPVFSRPQAGLVTVLNALKVRKRNKLRSKSCPVLILMFRPSYFVEESKVKIGIGNRY